MNNLTHHQWIDQYVRGNAPAETVRLLEAALREDAQFRGQFLEYLNVDAELSALAAGKALEKTGSKEQFSSLPAAPEKRRGFVAAAAAVLVGIGLWSIIPSVPRSAYATVSDSVGHDLPRGSLIFGQRLRFESGSVAFRTRHGARVVVEAPAEIQFESAHQLRLFRGKIAAECPEPAHGFTVLTPEGRATDLGTRFGVDVPEHGAAEIHVFEGEVLAQARGAVRTDSLKTGAATALAEGESRTRDLRTAAFIQSDELPELAAGLAAGQQARARSKWNALQKDPALIAAFNFQTAHAREGTFRLAQGRWPGSRAPEFVNAGDHLKTDTGGNREYPRLTLAAWVRIDRMGDPYQSLYHTDGWSSDHAGQVHWMLTREARMRLALRGNTLAEGTRETGGFPDSLTPVLSERGRWVHLATVYDSVAGTVRFYVNGRFDSETRQHTALPARLGPAQIGNWNRSDRRLSGRMDELLLLGRTLDDAEIRELFEAGNPYR
jgi:hypothetical protein